MQSSRDDVEGCLWVVPCKIPRNCHDRSILWMSFFHFQFILLDNLPDSIFPHWKIRMFNFFFPFHGRVRLKSLTFFTFSWIFRFIAEPRMKNERKKTSPCGKAEISLGIRKNRGKEERGKWKCEEGTTRVVSYLSLLFCIDEKWLDVKNVWIYVYVLAWKRFTRGCTMQHYASHSPSVNQSCAKNPEV